MTTLVSRMNLTIINYQLSMKRFSRRIKDRHGTTRQQFICIDFTIINEFHNYQLISQLSINFTIINVAMMMSYFLTKVYLRYIQQVVVLETNREIQPQHHHHSRVT